MILTYQIDEEVTIKDFLKNQGISRHLGRKFKLYGKYYINKKEALNWHKLKPGDLLEVEYQEPENPDIIPSDYPLSIVYEDDYILVVNKPGNLSTQPSKRHYEDNVVSRAKKYFLDTGIFNNVHIVNRLDYATSGLIIIAKNGFIHHQFSETSIEKKYLAVIDGFMDFDSGVIDLPIERANPESIRRMVSETGKYAVTKYKVLSKNNKNSLLELTLETGRCHQIRVHLSHIRHPILGDRIYGTESDQLYLHSYFIRFVHPFTKEILEFTDFPKWYSLFF